MTRPITAHLRRALILSILLASNAMAAETAPASDSTITIKAQSLATALQVFSRQSGLQVGFESEIARGIQTQGTQGAKTPAQALSALLDGTGLEYRFVNDQTVVIREKGSQQSTTTAVDLKAMRLAQSDFSASKTEADSTLEEIIVTAQKREERLIDVPISIVALSSAELQKRKITGIDKLASAIPGLMVSQGVSGRTITLRGVSNLFGGASLIGMYLDEGVVTSSIPYFQLDLRTYDLERVEVLRGPQGTLYGEGSAGGTIRFVTKSPALNAFAATAEIETAMTENGAPSGRIEGMVNIPLIEEELGLRIAGTVDHQGGWIDQPGVNKDDINEQDLMDVRIKGLWRPAPQFAVSAMAVIHRDESTSGVGEDDDGNYAQVFSLTTTPNRNSDYNLYNLTFTYDFASAQLLSTSGYTEQEVSVSDQGRRYPLFPGAPPVPHYYVSDFPSELNDFTQEVRLTSTGSGLWRWTIGGLYRHTESAMEQTFYFGVPGIAGAPLPGPIVDRKNNQSESWAAFGDVSYKVTDRFTLGTGLRYFEDEQKYKSSVAAGAPAPLGPTQEGKFHTLNPRIYVQYKWADNLNTYASAAKGFRSGGFNQVNRPTYDPESMWTYELGTKMALLDGRLSVDAAIFLGDYSDYQIVGVVLVPGTGPANITSNAGDAKLRGIEGALTWHPADRWTLGLNGTYVDTEFVEINATTSSHAVGDPLDSVPKHAYTASVQRDFAWLGKPGFVRADYSQQGRTEYRNRSLGPQYVSETKSIDMLNFNVGLSWSERFSLGFFGQNLLDDRDFTSPLWVEGNALRSRPRTYGINLGMAF